MAEVEGFQRVEKRIREEHLNQTPAPLPPALLPPIKVFHPQSYPSEALPHEMSHPQSVPIAPPPPDVTTELAPPKVKKKGKKKTNRIMVPRTPLSAFDAQSVTSERMAVDTDEESHATTLKKKGRELVLATVEANIYQQKYLRSHYETLEAEANNNYYLLDLQRDAAKAQWAQAKREEDFT